MRDCAGSGAAPRAEPPTGRRTDAGGFGQGRRNAARLRDADMLARRPPQTRGPKRRQPRRAKPTGKPHRYAAEKTRNTNETGLRERAACPEKPRMHAYILRRRCVSPSSTRRGRPGAKSGEEQVSPPSPLEGTTGTRKALGGFTERSVAIAPQRVRLTRWLGQAIQRTCTEPVRAAVFQSGRWASRPGQRGPKAPGHRRVPSQN